MCARPLRVAYLQNPFTEKNNSIRAICLEKKPNEFEHLGIFILQWINIVAQQFTICIR